MKGEPNQFHHFIPQCYLKNFSTDKKHIHIYSKHKMNNFEGKIKETAGENYFYKIPEKFIPGINTTIFHSNFFEQDFFANNIESLFGPILRTINSSLGNNTNMAVLSREDKEIFAALIAVQYLRMPNIRDKYWSLLEGGSKARIEIIKSFYANQFIDKKEFINSIGINIDKEGRPINHSAIFSDDFLIKKLQDDLLDKIWIFYVSKEDDFYTSDNPILLKPHLDNQPAFDEGFCMRGVEIIFPIGSSVLLTMWDKTYFEEKKHQDNKFVIADYKTKRQYNCFQYIWANDEVYSKTDNFIMIELLKKLNGGNEIFKTKPKILINGK